MSAQVGVALLTDDAQLSFCCVVDWDADKLCWFKAPRSTVASVEERGFTAIFDNLPSGGARCEGPAALRAAEATLGKESKAESLGLRVLIDGSAVEVFTSTGQAVSTRVYMSEGASAPRQLLLISSGGSALLSQGAAWEMGSAWRE